ncbi:hypothetical protein HHI36_001505, partial [Cryptolaemus montrouzieri]
MRFCRRFSSIETANNNDFPTKQRIEEFWTGQLATPANYNTKASWIDEEGQKCQDFTNMKYILRAIEEDSIITEKLRN